MAYKHEELPPPLDSTSSPPPLFDGTTRLYVNYTCPFVQRVWITRNYKGLQDKIKLVGIDLENRPAWYKEKVYPGNKVPSLEHNGKVIGESLDLIKYLESNFEGPSLVPSDDPERKKFGEELLTYVDTFVGSLYRSLKGDTVKAADEQFDYLENALKKFDDGPYLLGQFSLVDIAYIPFVEKFQVFLSDVFKYDITAGRPKLAAFLEEINKIEAYKVTKADPKEIVAAYKKKFLGLQGKIKLVGIDLENRPAWYKEKVYPGNKVPSLEHNGKVIGESLDLIKYLESNFEGPSLVPNDDPGRKKFGEELLTYVVTFVGSLYRSLKGDTVKAADEQFDYLENALKKFDDGPYLLGQFSLVDIAYIPFVEQFQVFLSDVFKYDITAGRPKLAAFLEEINKIVAYKVTKADPKEIAAAYKKKFLVHSLLLT
ncbi:hypothetical protein ACFX15_031915 [Malus domestica]